jgi:hypothetical protein
MVNIKTRFMKKLLFCLTVLAMGSWLTACKDDDGDDKNVANEFTVNGTTYALTDVYVDSISTHTVGDKVYHSYDVVIVSNGISFSDSEGFSGSGDAVRFELYSTQDGVVPSATYLPGDPNNGIETARVFLGFNSGSPIVYDDEITDGEVTVSKSGDSHVFNFTLTLEDNSTITGSFKGEATVADSF